MGVRGIQANCIRAELGWELALETTAIRVGGVIDWLVGCLRVGRFAGLRGLGGSFLSSSSSPAMYILGIWWGRGAIDLLVPGAAGGRQQF